MQKYFDLLKVMTEKEIKVHYKGARLGFVWLFLEPILQMLVIGIVFSFFIKIPNYFLFLLVGLLPWTFFSLSVTRATNSIVHERSLLHKAKFPVAVIPISVVLSNFFNIILVFCVVFVLIVVTGNLTFLSLLLLLITLIWLIFITIGVSLFTSSLQVRFRDINFVVQAGILLLFYSTPVLYSITLIPQHLQIVFALNPLSTIFEILHFLISGGNIYNIQIGIVLSNILISVIIFVLGLISYEREHNSFVDYL